MIGLSTRSTQMAADMAEQPSVIARLISRRASVAAAVRGALRAPLEGIVLVGRGSSENAALFGRLLLERVADLPASIGVPGPLAGRYGGWLAIGISQSGETPGIADTLAWLGDSGAATVAITNESHSSLAASVDVVVDMRAGPERAVPATKTFTASLVALLLIADTLDGDAVVLDELADAVEEVVADDHRAHAAAVQLAELDGWACVGNGLLLPVAREAALKLEEAALVVADHHSAASFRHGPIATAGPARPVLVFERGQVDEALGLARSLHRLGSPVVSVGPWPGADLPLPSLSEPLLAVVAAVRAQQLALALAVERGLDPDHPPGLEKVTFA